MAVSSFSWIYTMGWISLRLKHVCTGRAVVGNFSLCLRLLSATSASFSCATGSPVSRVSFFYYYYFSPFWRSHVPFSVLCLQHTECPWRALPRFVSQPGTQEKWPRSTPDVPARCLNKPEESQPQIFRCKWQLRSPGPSGSQQEKELMAGNSQLLHPCLCLGPAAGKYRTLFVFLTVCCLWLFKSGALQASYLCITLTKLGPRDLWGLSLLI